ncbi:DUF1015 domain-containing protein [Candidatus Acetothermia bacterium]|nr:MAG: DUF1015 domain-containing protein [Candidatus Acetothermia bacterium]
MGPKEEEEYRSRSPYNIVRVIGGKVPPKDEAEYARRGETFRNWLSQGVLVRDPEPALYAYYQEFGWEGETYTRKGFVALLDLQGSPVKAHERTLKGPKEDRLKLLRATEANFGHIFMLYQDPSRRASGAADQAVAGRPPDMEAVDDFGNRHLLWRITDEQVIRKAEEALANLPVFIADGHHRFETAVTFMQECFSKGWKPIPPESFTSRMVTLVNTAEPGLVIRPIHRIVHSLHDFDPDRLLRELERDFRVETLSSAEEAQARLSAGAGKEHVFVLCLPGERFYAISLRDEGRIPELVPGERSSAWKSLDVSILHKAVLERLLGIDEGRLAAGTNVSYTPYREQVIEEVERGKGQLGILLNPTRVEEVMAVAAQGERMPQKSTDFYPKLLTGMVAMKMEIEK